MTPEMGALKTRLKKTWESGDYGVFAKYLQTGALEFFDRLNIPPGTTLLDVACGAGQLTLPAARRGIRVTGLDLAGNLVRQAQKKAAAEGLDVRIDEGDAEQLPYEDGSFDVVMSLIGAMFAPRPELVASEMIRVCRPGGRIVMGNWTAAGHVGQMFKVIGAVRAAAAEFPVTAAVGQRSDLPRALRCGGRRLEGDELFLSVRLSVRAVQGRRFLLRLLRPDQPRLCVAQRYAGGAARRADRAVDAEQSGDRRDDARRIGIHRSRRHARMSRA